MNLVSSLIKATAKNKKEIRVENRGKYAKDLFFIKFIKIIIEDKKIAAEAPMYIENMLVPANRANKGKISNIIDKNGFISYPYTSILLLNLSSNSGKKIA